MNTQIDPQGLSPDDPAYHMYWRKKKDVRWFQRSYARKRLQDVLAEKPGKPDPKSAACKDFIKYISLAADNGDACAAQEASNAYGGALCTEKNEEKRKHYRPLGQGCPTP